MLKVSIIIALLLAGNFSRGAGYCWKSFPEAHPEERYQSAHFILTAPAGADAGRLLAELEAARREVLAFGLTLPTRVEARSYRTTYDFTRGSGGRSFNLARAVGERMHLQPLSLLLRRGDLSQALRHELTHVALTRTGPGLPQWLHEGVAMQVAGEMQSGREAFRNLEALEDSLAVSRSHATLRAAYGASRYLVDRLLEEYGRQRLLSLVRGVKRESDFDRRFRDLTGVDVAAWCDRRLAM